MARIDPNKLALEERVVQINRVAKVHKGGRRFSFSAVIVVGDGNGHVGVGLGKAGDVPESIRKGVEDAKKNIVRIPMVGTTIPHEVRVEYSAARVMLKPASKGTGVIAGGAVRAVVEAAGIRDILAKVHGSTNPVNVTRATLNALAQPPLRRGAVARAAASSSGSWSRDSPMRRSARGRWPMPGSLRVTQTRSTISHIARNRATIRALGLHGIGSSSTLPDNPAVRGMVRQVRFLVTVEELPAGAAQDDVGEVLMKIHDLHPAAGSVTKRTRVGRGIAAGKGKTAGRGTKGQKSRAGASIPAWFEGGQTPLHIRIPKLRGFRNINDVEYEVVNVGAISAAVDAGKLEVQKGAPVTVNADTLKQAGLVRRDRLPLKILGEGEVGAKLFVLADAFTRSAREKIEAAGGTAQVIEIPTSPLAALGRRRARDADAAAKPARAKRARKTSTDATRPTRPRRPRPRPRRGRGRARGPGRGRRGANAEAAPAAERAAKAKAATAEPAAEADAPEDATEPGTPAEADEADAADNG